MTDSPGAQERNLGEQPIAALMIEHKLAPHDLVTASTEQITHKMVQRAVKGRRLTPNVMSKIRRALNAATGRDYDFAALFNYGPPAKRGDPPSPTTPGPPQD